MANVLRKLEEDEPESRMEGRRRGAAGDYLQMSLSH
jgi:hypothetical protein